ncbi:hypothetical protein VCHA28O22_11067 [Vibrio chagasii]|nr:hypothetical protein VCHA28O22_11067 [Vibrio chagasii]CAH7304217.1 hypothetical protein VCHA50O393_40312 [Vibrio chagasii]
MLLIVRTLVLQVIDKALIKSELNTLSSDVADFADKSGEAVSLIARFPVHLIGEQHLSLWLPDDT